MTGLTVKLWPTVQLDTLQLEPAAGMEIFLTSVVQYGSR